MTKTFSALVAAFVVGITLPAQADLDENLLTFLENYDLGDVIQHGYGGPAPIAPLQLDDADTTLIIHQSGPFEQASAPPRPSEPLHTAPVPVWIFEFRDRSPRDVALMRWSSTRPHTWGSEAAPYQVAHPGPGYVGVIPAPIPDGWVVTNRCLAWDEAYADAERPLGDCYIFEMRPMVLGPIVID